MEKIAISEEKNKTSFRTFVTKRRKPMIRQEVKEYMNENKNKMAFSHLECWFTKKYQGESKSRCLELVKKEHDNSLEIEEVEEETGLKLTDREKKYVINQFAKGIIESIDFGGASIFYDEIDMPCDILPH